MHRLVATHQLVSCMHVTVACAETQHHGIAHLGLLGADVRPQQIHRIHLGAPFRGIYYYQRVGNCPLAMLVRRHQQAVYTRFQHRHRHPVERQPLALHAGIKHPFLHWPVPHILFLTGICRQRETLAELLAADCMSYASKKLRVRKQRAFGLPQPLDAEDDIPLHRGAVDVAILVFHVGQFLQLFWHRDRDVAVIISRIEREALAVSLAIDIGHVHPHLIRETRISGELYVAVGLGHEGNTELAFGIGDQRIGHQGNHLAVQAVPKPSAPPRPHHRPRDGINHLCPTHRHLGV